MSRLSELLLDLAWSQWSALGVSASGVRIPQRCIDLEAAIVFAPALEELDPRLHSEVLDWCVTFASEFTSVASLKQRLQLFGEDHRKGFAKFAAKVNRHGHTKWPTDSAATRVPSDFKPSGKSRLKVDRSASIQLRARKIFGISARADVLTGLALDASDPERPPLWTNVNRLVPFLGYTRRNLSDALRDLALGQALGMMEFGRVVRYGLIQPVPLRQLLEPLPSEPLQPWAQRLALTVALLDVERGAAKTSRVSNAVALRKALDVHRDRFLELRDPIPELRPEHGMDLVVDWLEPRLQP